MSEELFDVVDADDNVIKVLPRSEVHRQKLLHRAIHVFVFRSDGQMLIHQRSPAKEEFPSVWTSSCSGHVSSGETYESSAPRELQEELGLQASLLPLQKFSAQESTSWEFTVLFRANSDSDVTPDPQEMTAIAWMHVDEIWDWMNRSPAEFSPAFRLLIDWYYHNCVSENGRGSS
jgi:isopentenyl-diphosphate Delta-isomerase